MPEKTVEFTFKRPWTHGGTQYAAGDKAQLSEPEARWLKQRGADKPAAAPKAAD